MKKEKLTFEVNIIINEYQKEGSYHYGHKIDLMHEGGKEYFNSFFYYLNFDTECEKSNISFGGVATNEYDMIFNSFLLTDEWNHYYGYEFGGIEELERLFDKFQFLKDYIQGGNKDNYNFRLNIAASLVKLDYIEEMEHLIKNDKVKVLLDCNNDYHWLGLKACLQWPELYQKTNDIDYEDIGELICDGHEVVTKCSNNILLIDSLDDLKGCE